jgi:hypothetical protein
LNPNELVSLTKSNIEGFHFLRKRYNEFRKIYINIDKNSLRDTHLHSEFRQIISKGSGPVKDDDSDVYKF